ncbi:unnamed protein product, partial [Rotaria socialis]
TLSSTPNLSDIATLENNSAWSSPSSAPTIKTETSSNDDGTSPTQTINSNGSTSKLRSDTFLRSLLNDEVRPQKVVVEAPFVYNSRHKSSQRASIDMNPLIGNKTNGNNSRTMLKSQISLPTNNISDSPTWDQKPKRTKRKHSHSFGSRNNPTNTATTTT